MRVYLEGVGLCGPGLPGWAASRPVLAGVQDYVAAPTLVPPASMLQANERRRAVQIVKIALAVGAEAFGTAACDPAATATVFASSGGDGDTIHEIMTALTSPNRELSPTKFHNSVHNASSGYWSIAARSRAASTSLCCHDDSFAAGLLEAAVQTVTQGEPVGLIAYDVEYPWPLSEVRPVGSAFAVALVLAAAPSDATLARLELGLAAAGAATLVAEAGLEALRRGTPSARALPLLCALAEGRDADVTIGYLDDMALAVTMTAWPMPKAVRRCDMLAPGVA